MKTFTLFLFLPLCYLCLAQNPSSENANFKATYKVEFKKFVGADKTSVEQMILFVKKDASSIFLNHKMLLRDSIQNTRETDASDVVSLFCINNFVVQQFKNVSIHNEKLAGEVISIKENIKLDWQLIGESKIFNTYNCKKATVNYGGRSWIAWYAIDIPISAGPYKFNGLPGLILEIYDAENVFHFTIETVAYGSFPVNTDLSNYFIKKAISTIGTMSSNDFYKSRYNFSKLSLDDSIKYMNRNTSEKASGMIMTSPQGEILNTGRPPKIQNFIERFE